jgi:Asp-tRNA(Asn)/Glu-tRNA(Gln) amidotransferase A subunit family amidase
MEKAPRETTYDLKSVDMPRMTGPILRLIVTLAESPLRGLIIPGLLQTCGITRLREQTIDDPPTMRPIHHTGTMATESWTMPKAEWPHAPAAPAPGFYFATVHDYAKAYRDGSVTPEDVARGVLDAIEASDAAEPPLRAIIAVERDDVLKQAVEATKRVQSGRALSVFDGVPVAVKDELDVVPYPTTVGTAFLGRTPCTEDATVVTRMRAAGALLIGKANMHEIGIGITGLNPIHGTPRNPYDPRRYTGGSSSGPGAAVAAGLCPVAIGADGGGSIRVPASFCGVVGLKPTYGRVSEYGAAPLCWSVAHIGPLAATATDAALAYAAMAGPDPRDPTSLRQPTPTLDGWDRLDLSDLRLGIYLPWFRHASASVVSACEEMLEQFKGKGAKLREVVIPDLEAARVAHLITTAAEMVQALSATYAAHHREHGLDVRLNLASARAFTASDYVRAQQVRTRLIANFNRALEHVDAIVTPTAGLTAPIIPETALSSGESDLATLTEIMRFVTPANLTGLPAISFPVGYDDAGLPIGMQAIGHAWQEHTLLRLALSAERAVEHKSPRMDYRVLPEQT